MRWRKDLSVGGKEKSTREDPTIVWPDDLENAEVEKTRDRNQGKIGTKDAGAKDPR